MRLFLAIQLNEEMKEALLDVQQEMRLQGVRGNYTNEENLHLTLAFIGEYHDAALVLEILREIDFAPFAIQLKGLGAFHGLWWAGLEESLALKAVVKRLRRALAEAGIPFDRKKFSPHITLIRKPVSRDGRIPAKALETDLSAGMTVDHISLMRSDRGKHGMIYTEVRNG